MTKVKGGVAVKRLSVVVTLPPDTTREEMERAADLLGVIDVHAIVHDAIARKMTRHGQLSRAKVDVEDA